MALKVFVDFDGTITKGDVGNAFFKRFGGPVCESIVQEFREGKLSATECFRQEVAAIGRLNEGDAKQFFNQQKIDETFRGFIAFCREQGIELLVVSDGLDYYIREVFAAHGIEDVSFFANQLELTLSGCAPGTDLAVRFPFTDAECTRCACCKRNIMLTRSAENDIIVLVGEGDSDRCPALYADIVFAKDALQTFCQQENISYFPYATFRDVTDRLDQLLKPNGGTGRVRTLRGRRRAALRRREAFIRE